MVARAESKCCIERRWQTRMMAKAAVLRHVAMAAMTMAYLGLAVLPAEAKETKLFYPKFPIPSAARQAASASAADVGGGIGGNRGSSVPMELINGGPSSSSASWTNKIEYKTNFFTQTLDHFSFQCEEQFQQRYLINDKYWKQKDGAPIFLYCGNEGAIDWFAVNTGFMWDIAPEFDALLVFIEHRYYGESMPFGSQEIAFKNKSTVGFLTSEQALADFAVLITDLKKNLTAHRNPVILFGGSYGGMLAAWMRLKYPHIVQGAIASSAPILQFEDVVPTDTFYRIVSEDFKRESDSCFETIRSSWELINEKGSTKSGREELRKQFRLCDPLKDSSDLKNWLSSAYSYLAMVNYPVPSSFVAPLPAFPIREVCERMDNAPRGSTTLERILAGVSVYYNYTGKATCFDVGQDIDGASGWDYQACTEMVMPMSSNANNSLFESFEWDLKAYSESCRASYGINPRPTWITTQFESRDIKSVLKKFGSNIVFSNGLLDPWSGGSVLEDLSSTLVAVNLPEGAHHLDLRSATADDPQSLVMMRKTERVHIRAWLREYQSKKHGFFFGPRMTFTMAGFGTIICGLIGAAVAVAVIKTAARRRAMQDRGLRQLTDRLIDDPEDGEPSESSSHA